MKNCPYCGASGSFYFKISSRTYNRCLGCDLIYKESQDSYDKVMAHYRDDYFERYSADQMSGERERLFGNFRFDSKEERYWQVIRHWRRLWGFSGSCSKKGMESKGD
jgi:hypothetical protein